MASTKTSMVEEKYGRKDAVQVQRLIADLVSLHGSSDTILRLMPYGSLAIRELRDQLLNGRPSGVYQARQQLVFALAELGGRSVLLEYLSRPLHADDPVTRFGEEAVQSSAARELSRWRDTETFQFLLQFAREDHRTGAFEALAEFERPEAAPVFITALEDDFYRPPAEDGLRRLGENAKLPLIRAAVSPTVFKGDEPPWSVRRRASALALLKNLSLNESDWRVLRALLKDPHPEIAAGTGALAAAVAEKTDRAKAVAQMLRTYPFAIGDWRIRAQLDDALLQLQPEAADSIRRALKRGAPQKSKAVVERLEYLGRKMHVV